MTSPSQSLDRVSVETAFPSARTTSKLETAGQFILRYGLVCLLILFGTQKWTATEAQGIQAWVAHSPFLSWIYRIFTLQGGSELIGAIELLIAGLIAARRWFPTLAVVGSVGAAVMFLTTLSFLVTTPGMDGDSQGFLIKDILLLGASIWSAGEALNEARKRLHSWKTGAPLNLDENGIALKGYDPVAFFTQDRPVEGISEFQSEYAGARYLFASVQNKALFEANRKKFEPQFGGFCAYGVSRGYQAPVKTEAFQIINGRLLMQYDLSVKRLFNEDARGNLRKADTNWRVFAEEQDPLR